MIRLHIYLERYTSKHQHIMSSRQFSFLIKLCEQVWLMKENDKQVAITKPLNHFYTRRHSQVSLMHAYNDQSKTSLRRRG